MYKLHYDNFLINEHDDDDDDDDDKQQSNTPRFEHIFKNYFSK